VVAVATDPNGYRCFQPLNCYADHGANGVDAIDLSEGASAVDCAEACSTAEQCTGFVWAQSEEKCWTRNNIDLSQCERDDGFVTCVLPANYAGGKGFLAPPPLESGMAIGEVFPEISDTAMQKPRDSTIQQPSDAGFPEAIDANILERAGEADSESTDSATSEEMEPQAMSTEDLVVLDLLFSENLTLSAEVASQTSMCHGAYMDALERASPGCLAQCQSRGVCGAISRAISAYLPTRDRSAAKRVVCSSTGAFACKCGSLIRSAGGSGIPTSVGSLYSQCR